MWFDLKPCDLDLCKALPFVLRVEGILPCSSVRAFAILTSSAELSAWMDECVHCQWTSGSPHAFGATREVELTRMRVRERFLAWDVSDTEARIAFQISATTLPVATRMIEEVQLRSLSKNETRIVWTIHYRPSAWIRPVHSFARRAFRRSMTQSIANLARYAMLEGALPIRERDPLSPFGRIEGIVDSNLS